jgi:inorganic phosphate transporter, PiT family
MITSAGKALLSEGPRHMDPLSFQSLPPVTLVGLLAAIVVAIVFEAVNGFHDTANAVATVIYTNSLKPRNAVVLSGICNFVGVYLGGVGVAFAVVHLLPVDLLVNVGSGSGTAMIFAILVSAITWNVGTWYRGIPVSSSHTLIGAIMGVGLANALMHGEPIFRGVNLGNFQAVFLSLLISPLLGFTLAAIMLSLLRMWIRDPRLYEPPQEHKPPTWVRTMLVCTSAGVSLAHGSNDGQKGVGLMMIILIGTLPALFALNPEYSANHAGELVHSLEHMAKTIGQAENGPVNRGSAQVSNTKYRVMSSLPEPFHLLSRELAEVANFMNNHDYLVTVNSEERALLRKKILVLEDHIKTMERSGNWHASDADKLMMSRVRDELKAMIDYAPAWVILIVAVAIGCGTMVGWKRVVVTVGERIGKSPLTYAQGASSELVAMLTIGMAAVSGLPVSTTQVLSSGVTGTMVVSGAGVRYMTVRDIALAWLFTFPASMLLAGTLFFIFHSWATL